MAIHIWRDGAYRSVDLAQYGQDGLLDGAYAWIGGRWATLWKRTPDAPDYTWSDDFTAPSLHERWTLIAGEYTPPGLTDAGLFGPDLGDSFEVTIDALPNGGVVVMPIADDQMQTAFTLQIDADGVSIAETGQIGQPPGTRITVRRADGQWSVLAGGEALIDTNGDPMSLPDTHVGPAHLAVMPQGATVTFIGYREL